MMINRIEVLIKCLLKDFILSGSTGFKLISRFSWQNLFVGIDNVLRTDESSANLVIENIFYTRMSSRQRFSLLVYVLGEVHDLMLVQGYCTYRELFYRNTALSLNQSQMNRAINDACSVLRSTSWELGIFGSGKGYIAGSLRIFMNNGDIIDCNAFKGPTLLPPNFTAIDFFETSAQYILVVEKDTIFEKLMCYNVFSLIGVDIILLTGKGYPDICIRWILCKLWNEKQLPIYVLTDADPFGIEIMLIYRYGSRAKAHYASQLACPQLHWLGIHPSEIIHMNIPTESLGPSDYRKIKSLLEREYVCDGVRKEIEVLGQIKRKAKIENMTMYTFPLFIKDYIVNKIKRQVVI